MKLTKLIYKQNLQERKQVGTVYHFTRWKSLIDILDENHLKAKRSHGNFEEYGNYFISTTRDKNFSNVRPIYGYEGGVGIDVGLKLNGNKLSSKYKTQPIDDNWMRPFKSKTSTYFGDEAEQFWYGKRIDSEQGIKNVLNYVESIVIPKDKFTDQVLFRRLPLYISKELGPNQTDEERLKIIQEKLSEYAGQDIKVELI